MSNKQKGVTLIEMVVVLVIFSIVLMVAFKSVKTMFSASELSDARLGAKRVMAATQAFYESHCGLKDNAQPTIAQLVADGYLTSTSEANTELGASFQPSIVWGVAPTGSRIIVTLTLPAGMNAASYLNALAADRVSGQTVYWDDAPAMEARREGNEVIEMFRMYQPGICI